MEKNQLDEIAEWAIGGEIYRREEILNLPSNYLLVEIVDRIPKIIRCEILHNGDVEQRQFSMFKMIENICNKYEIPDLIFGYCGHDRTPDINGPFFTHSRIRGNHSRNILAPCFTFYGYPERSPDKIKSYENTREELILNDSINRIQWKDKKNSCIFVGSITEHNNRLDNTTIEIGGDVDLIIVDQPADSKNFISRESLSGYKYLLHLNGNGGAYASRFKYLLGTRGLVFYNYNSGNENNFWEEWWMHSDYFIEDVHFVSCKNKLEFRDKLSYFFKNQEEASNISNNSFCFFSEFLNPKNIELYWVSLLRAYSKKLK